MLHEDEPGAWEFARELEARGVPLDEIRLRADVDPLAFGQVVALPRDGSGRRSCTRTSCTPTSTGSSPARWRASRCGSRRSTASTSSAKGASSGSPTAPSARSRTCTSRSRRGSPATSPRPRASTRTASRSSTTGSRPRTACAPYARTEPRLLCVGRLIPIKGHLVLLRALAQARVARAGGSRSTSPAAGRSSPRSRSSRASSGSSDAVRFLGFVSPVQAAIEERGDRRRALARRGLRDGRARGDGAGAARDRERGRRAAGDRRRRRDRARRPSRATPTRSPTRSSRSPAISTRPPRWGEPGASARSPSSPRSAAPSGSRSSTARARLAAA